MDRKQFAELLAARGIDPKLVSFDSSTGEGYNIRKNHLRWETFVRDNGCEFDCVGFASESDALQHMLDELTALHAQS